MDKLTFADKVITALGGTGKAARLFGVSEPAVSRWRHLIGIPKMRLMWLRYKKPSIFRGELKQDPED